MSHHSREGRQRRHEDKVTREDRHGVEWVEPRSAKANSEGRDHGTETFVEDRKGDRHNLTYGTLHRYSIPNYYRSGRGNVLGLSKYYKIDRDRSEVDSLLVGVRQGGEFGRQDRNLLGKLEQTESRLMRVRPEIEDISNLNARLDFIPLNSHRSRKRRRIGWSSRSPETPSSNEETDHHYRSIEGQAKAAEEVDEDLEALSATSESDFEESSILDPNDETRKRSVQLARQVEQQPADLDGWLELIKHQDALLGLGFREDRRPITNVEKRSLADVKISIYEKALKRVGPHPDRDHLILGMLEEGAKIWETQKLLNRWRSVLQENPGSIRLWIKYLAFQQSSFINFNYEQCRSTFVECLKIAESLPRTAQKDNIQTYIFLRMTLSSARLVFLSWLWLYGKQFWSSTFSDPTAWILPRIPLDACLLLLLSGRAK